MRARFARRRILGGDVWVREDLLGESTKRLRMGSRLTTSKAPKSLGEFPATANNDVHGTHAFELPAQTCVLLRMRAT